MGAYQRGPFHDSCFSARPLFRSVRPKGTLLTKIPGRKGAFKGDLGAMATAAFDPQGNRIVTASDYGAVIWNARTGEPLITLDDQRWLLCAAFSPNGARIVTASEDHTARIWDAKTGKQLQKLEHPDQVTFAGFSRPDGARIVTASSDKKARIWDTKTGQVLKVLDGHDGPLRGAAFSPDGGRIVTASEDSTARVRVVRAARRFLFIPHLQY